jgi:hypothetical protein
MPEKRKTPGPAVAAGVVILLLVLAALFGLADLTPLLMSGHR